MFLGSDGEIVLRDVDCDGATGALAPDAIETRLATALEPLDTPEMQLAVFSGKLANDRG